MSFFFDVWMQEGFVLASDVILIGDDEQNYLHKIARCANSSSVNCAIAVCGDHPESCIQFFSGAVATGNTLRDIAKRFAEQWTGKFAGTTDYSAVHLVGFEKLNGSAGHLPQMWYWRNREGDGEFFSEEALSRELASFDDPVPVNNHIPRKIFDPPYLYLLTSPEQEYAAVIQWLRQQQPVFTWNGHTDFWRSAARTVNTAFDLVIGKKRTWTLKDVTELAGTCLRFLVGIGSLLPEKSITLSPDDEGDILVVRSDKIYWHKRAKLPDRQQT